MIFAERRWDDGFLIVCGNLWPGASKGAPMPEGWPHSWRSEQREDRQPVDTGGEQG